MTETMTKTEIPNELDTRVLARILDEGYGPGAWHGADFKAALADVPSDLAFWRPSPGRHNIAEIAMHHAYYVHDVRGRLSGRDPGPFSLEGQDWFVVSSASAIGWPAVLDTVEREQRALAAAVATAGTSAALGAAERLDLVLGITCHAVYHAGQVQLLKKLAEESH
jgi:DinB superfamily